MERPPSTSPQTDSMKPSASASTGKDARTQFLLKYLSENGLSDLNVVFEKDWLAQTDAAVYDFDLEDEISLRASLEVLVRNIYNSTSEIMESEEIEAVKLLKNKPVLRCECSSQMEQFSSKDGVTMLDQIEKMITQQHPAVIVKKMSAGIDMDIGSMLKALEGKSARMVKFLLMQ